ncbi:hypothetical protein REH65_25380 [Saccharopolyspora sp. ID03-671]|uniref:hypothetical protein n=1 Tax=Saccharopolyspora sp. ID03-671 TaxID=3073066 RepID=UPI00324F4296
MTDLEWVPQSCTLPSAKRPLRVAEWDALLVTRLTEVSRPEPLRLRLELSGGAGVHEQVSDLAGRESGCCSFFTFTTTGDDTSVHLDIAVDPAHEPVLNALAHRASTVASGRP